MDPFTHRITRTNDRSLADAHRPWRKRERKDAQPFDSVTRLSIQWIPRNCETVARTRRGHTCTERRRPNGIPTIDATKTPKGCRFTSGPWDARSVIDKVREN